MNRRDLFRQLAAVGVASGTTVSTVAADPAVDRTKPALAVFECDGPMSDTSADRIKSFWNDYIANDGPLKGLKAVVLGDGIRLTILDGNGHVLNRRTRARR